MSELMRTAHWFAVFCKPRQEHKALVNLERQGFECFLPMALNPYQKFSRRNEDRTEPLFPRYLFLRAVPEVQNLAAVRSTRGVMDLVRCGRSPIHVPLVLPRSRSEIPTGVRRSSKCVPLTEPSSS